MTTWFAKQAVLRRGLRALAQRRWWVTLLLLAIVGSGSALWSSGALNPLIGAREQNAETAEEPLDVVFVADFSGSDRLVGADLERGFGDALKGRGGSSVLRIVRRDDQGKPEATLALAEGAAAGFRTFAIVGPGQSRGYAEFANQAEEGGVPVLVPVAPPGAAAPGKWVYTMQPSQELQAELAARLIREILPARRSVFITLPDTGSGYWPGIQNAFADANLPPPDRRLLSPDTESTALAKLGRELATTDLIFIDLPSAMAVSLVVGLRDAGHKGGIVGFGEMSLTGFSKRFADLPKERLSPGYYTNGVLAVTAFSPDEVDERSRGLVDAYHARNGADPSWAYAYGYDVGTLLMDFVATRSGEAAAGARIDPQQWRDGLREYLDALRIAAHPSSAFTGPISFDEGRQRDTQPSLLTYLYGRPIPFSRQFSHLPARIDPRTQDDAPEIAVRERYYDLVPIVFSGVRFHSISELDIDDGSYGADFDLWFRSPLRIEPDDILFPRAVDGTVKGTVVESLQESGGQYQRIRFQGKFRFDASPKDLLLERITLPLSWRHRKLEAAKLRFVIDSASFNSVIINSSIHEQIVRDKVIAPTVPYQPVGSVLGVESRAVRALGDPRARGGQLIYSEVDMKLVVESATSTLGPALARRVPSGVGLGLSVLLLAGGLILLRLKHGGLPTQMAMVLTFCAALLFAEVALFGSSLLASAPLRWVVWIRYGITAFYYVAGAVLINTLIWGMLRRSRGGQAVQATVQILTSIMVYSATFAAYYTNVLGRDVLPILATSSVLLTVVGLALRELILDAISGVAVHMDGSVKVGHWVSIKTKESTVHGLVEELGWRTIRVRSRDDEVHFVPNASVVTHVMSNFSLSRGFTRVEIPFSVSATADVGELLKVLGESVGQLLSKDPHVDAARPVRIVCREMDDDGNEMVVQVFYRAEASADALRTQTLEAISTVLRRMDALPSRRIAVNHLGHADSQMLA